LLNHDRNANDDAGFQVGLGINLARKWALELNGSHSSFDGPNQNRLKLTQFSVDLLRTFNFLPDSHIQPYLLVGAGGMDDRFTDGRGTGKFAGEVGGLLWAFGHQDGPQRLLLRTEAKYRREDGLLSYGIRDPGDIVFGAGLQFLWGAPTAAPVAATPPAPVDSDGDGVIDSEDQCPNTPKGDKVDVHGCTIKDEIQLKGLHFDTDSAVLAPDSVAVLNDAVATLNKNPSLVIEVHGHTDGRGWKKHNQVLSQKRADNRTEEGRAENRRVSLKIIGG
jgi:OmpA-OmpF porin, OOP family